jgi:hypothetical protein
MSIYDEVDRDYTPREENDPPHAIRWEHRAERELPYLPTACTVESAERALLSMASQALADKVKEGFFSLTRNQFFTTHEADDGTTSARLITVCKMSPLPRA